MSAKARLETPRDALALALFLAITAPTEAKSEEALALAKELAAGLSADDIRFAKITASRRAARVLQ
jgi:hypothetical protein